MICCFIVPSSSLTDSIVGFRTVSQTAIANADCSSEISDFAQTFSKILVIYVKSSLFRILLKRFPKAFAVLGDFFHAVILEEVEFVLIGSNQPSPKTENIDSFILDANVPRVDRCCLTIYKKINNYKVLRKHIKKYKYTYCLLQILLIICCPTFF